MAHVRGGFYEILVWPQVDERRSEYFNGLSIVQAPSGETLLSGYIEDNSRLFSLISSIRDMGLTLVSVNKKEGN